MKRLTMALTLACALLLAAASASAQPSSAQVMTCAKTYASHPWHFSASNATGTCASPYSSVYVVGDHMGLPYDWGGYMSLHTFDTGIQSGLGAGSYPGDGILDCTVGLDCSGFVSQCWDVGHYTTSSIPNLARAITIPELKRGDVMNDAGYHVALFDHLQPDGRPFFYEAIGYNVHQTFNQGWAYFNGYTPRRYLNDSDDPTVVAVGTATNPIVISSFPFTDTQDTQLSMSDMFDYCAAAPSTLETGHEVVYQFEVTTPGRLVVTLSDAVGVDIDLHIYEDLNELDCVARDNSTIDAQLDCGTYYLVADTWSNGSVEYAGEYDIVADFTPSAGGSCGAGHGYDFLGGLNTPCAFTGNPNLSFCNQNLASTTCLSTGDTSSDMSFCSVECSGQSDCDAAFPGGCCADIGSGDFFCLPATFCVAPDESPTDTSNPDTMPADTAVPPDTRADTSAADTSVPDTTAVDTSVPDTTTADTGTSVQDTVSSVDASVPDTSTAPDTTVSFDTYERIDTSLPPKGSDEGCGCQVRPSPEAGWPVGLVVFALGCILWLGRRREAHGARG